MLFTTSFLRIEKNFLLFPERKIIPRHTGWFKGKLPVVDQSRLSMCGGIFDAFLLIPLAKITKMVQTAAPLSSCRTMIQLQFRTAKPLVRELHNGFAPRLGS